MFRSLLSFFFHLLKPLLCTPALSGDCPTQRLSKYLPTIPTTHNIAVFVGAMARGRDDFADAYVDEKISISEYALSASVACGKVFLHFNFFFVPYLGSTDRLFSFLVLLCVGRTLGHHLIKKFPAISLSYFVRYFGFHSNGFLILLFFYNKKKVSPSPKICTSTRREK